MALVLKDRVKETATANTTVSFTLGGAIAGFQSFSVVGNTNITYYAATDTNGNWEAGLGTYSTTGPTLTRTTILSSSNSGSAVTFSGTVSVFLTYPSSRSIYLDGTSAGINVSQAAFTSNGIPYASSTSALATGSALTFDGTNFATTGTSTAKSFIPTSSTAPTYGIYRPTSETIGINVGVAAPVKAGTYGLASGSVTTPAARMHIDSVGNLNGYSPTTTNAFGFYNAGGAFVKEAFGVAQINVNSLRISSLQTDDGVDSNTLPLATTLYIEGAPTAASLTTITSSYSLYIASGASYFGGAVTTTGTGTFSNTTGNKLVVSGNISQAAWTTTGPAISVATGTYTSSAGLTGTVAANSLGTPTFAATTASQTVTNAATLYIAAAPSNGTNVTITNAFALYVAAGKTSLTGNLLLNTTATYPSVAATTAITPQFQLSGTTLSTASMAQFAWNTNPYYTFNRSNGAVGVYTAVTSGTALGILQFNGADGTNFTGAASIASSADGAVSLGVVPARLVFNTADSGGTLTERLRITSAGGISFGSSGTAYGTTGQLLTSAGNAAPTWTSVTGSGNIVSATSPTITNLTLAAGTASLAPLVMTSGTSLTSPVAGAIEFDGSTFFSTDDVTDGRGFIPSTHFYRLTADGSAITTIANFFGATSGTALDNNIFYEVEAYLYFLKTTSGTATFTMTFSNAPVNNNAFYVGAPVGGVGTVGAPQTAALAKSTATAGALPVTGSLTTAVNHQYVLRAMFQANATTGGTINLQVTSSAGSITPLTGSYYKITRLPAANTGAYV